VRERTRQQVSECENFLDFSGHRALFREYRALLMDSVYRLNVHCKISAELSLENFRSPFAFEAAHNCFQHLKSQFAAKFAVQNIYGADF